MHYARIIILVEQIDLQTAKAVQIHFDSGPIWIPKSIMSLEYAANKKTAAVTMPEWLARRERLYYPLTQHQENRR